MNRHEKTLDDLAQCAATWEPHARLVGNVEAGAIVDAIRWALAAIEELRCDVRHVERESRELCRELDAAAAKLEIE